VLLLQSLSHRKNAHGFGELETRTNESALWSLPDVVARHPEAAAKRPTDNPSTLMFAVSSSKRDNPLLASERFRMAAAEQGRRHDHQDDG
jgi:hypothetical protein